MDTKLTALPASGPIANGDLFYVVASGISSSCIRSQLLLALAGQDITFGGNGSTLHVLASGTIILSTVSGVAIGVGFDGSLALTCQPGTTGQLQNSASSQYVQVGGADVSIRCVNIGTDFIGGETDLVVGFKRMASAVNGLLGGGGIP